MFVGLNVKCQLLPDFDHNFNVLTDFSKIIYFKISSVILQCCRSHVETGMVNLPCEFVQLFTVT